ncbi:hypothetical protein ZWY2020_023797 [Hordeum vulgare]|nr:hypothetical protein ZWY2020_023797 [Hordeum vulgare]
MMTRLALVHCRLLRHRVPRWPSLNGDVRNPTTSNADQDLSSGVHRQQPGEGAGREAGPDSARVTKIHPLIRLGYTKSPPVRILLQFWSIIN